MGGRDCRHDAVRLVFVSLWRYLKTLQPILRVLLAGILLASCSDSTAPALPTSEVAREELRVVTLAPHLAELVYAAGAGASLVGVSAYSNYPAEVLGLPQIGDAFLIDQEQLLLLRPDILLVWKSGTAAHTVDALRERGYRIEMIKTRGLNDIAAALRTIGSLTGHEATANAAADSFTARIDALRIAPSDERAVRVFYQVSSRPLYTVNGDHYVSELIELCGGENIFSDLGALAPLVAEEAVLIRDPELLLAGQSADDDLVLSAWRHWPALAANVLDNFAYLPADLIARPTPRLAEAGALICAAISNVREAMHQN